MTIGIIGAMEEEVELLRNRISVKNRKNIAGMRFDEGEYFKKNIVIVRSGIGKVNAAVCAQALIDHYSPDAVINTGIAGSMDEKVRLGDVVISTELVHHDFDTTYFEGEPRGFIPRLNMRYFPADSLLISFAESSAVKTLKKASFHKGRIASGDQFVSDCAAKKEIADIFAPLCVEMEGAAIAQTCFLNNVPFVIIRSISDNSDGDAYTYKDFIGIAVKNSIDIVEQIIKDYHR